MSAVTERLWVVRWPSALRTAASMFGMRRPAGGHVCGSGAGCAPRSAAADLVCFTARVTAGLVMGLVPGLCL
jgi:hypothetical protein